MSAALVRAIDIGAASTPNVTKRKPPELMSEG